MASAYAGILDRLAAEGLTTNVALKLTHLGLDVGQDVAADNVRQIARHAAIHRNFVRIDMEESPRVDATLAIYRRLRGEGIDNVGTVLQAYLPAAATPEEINAAVAEAIAETGASSPKDMGKVMKAVMPKLAGKNADGKAVNEAVRRTLGA